MSDLLKAVDSRTQLAGKNRMELLTFCLNNEKQSYGINVFKVREIYQNPVLTKLPGSHPAIIGSTYFRGQAIPIIDVAHAIGEPPLANNLKDLTIITTEFNRQMQGLLVKSVDRIINTGWEDIQKPPTGARRSFIVAITQFNNRLIEVIDVECMLEKISPTQTTIRKELLEDDIIAALHKAHILIADDSLVARKKIVGALSQLGTKVTETKTGQETWDLLNKLTNEGIDVTEEFLMLISDIEMPEMDGYTLTNNIRMDPRMKKLYITLHSSMSGDFNNALISQVGADNFLPKFHPDAFAEMVMARMREKLLSQNDKL